jgi:TolB-like protein
MSVLVGYDILHYRMDERTTDIRIAVLPFLVASCSASSGICAQLITDDLTHELVRTEGIRVTVASSVAPLVAKAMDIRSLAKKLDVQIVFEGTVGHDNNLLRITSRVVDPADGFHIWSERIETEPDLQALGTVSERIPSSLVSRIRPTKGFNERQHSLHHVRLILNSRAESGLLTDVCDRIQQSEYQVEEPNPDSRLRS